MADEKDDCCCKECGSPTGARKGAGKSLPDGESQSTQVTVMAGASGIDPATGGPVAAFFKPGKEGQFVLDELPHGSDGVLVLDNLTFQLINGRLKYLSSSGSGSNSFTPG